MARDTTSPFQVEWFNVTYRSVFSILTVVVLLVVGGAGYWYYFHIHAPRASAADAIEPGAIAIPSATISPKDKIDKDRCVI